MPKAPSRFLLLPLNLEHKSIQTHFWSVIIGLLLTNSPKNRAQGLTHITFIKAISGVQRHISSELNAVVKVSSIIISLRTHVL